MKGIDRERKTKRRKRDKRWLYLEREMKSIERD